MCGTEYPSCRFSGRRGGFSKGLDILSVYFEKFFSKNECTFSTWEQSKGEAAGEEET